MNPDDSPCSILLSLLRFLLFTSFSCTPHISNVSRSTLQYNTKVRYAGTRSSGPYPLFLPRIPSPQQMLEVQLQPVNIAYPALVSAIAVQKGKLLPVSRLEAQRSAPVAQRLELRSFRR